MTSVVQDPLSVPQHILPLIAEGKHFELTLGGNQDFGIFQYPGYDLGGKVVEGTYFGWSTLDDTMLKRDAF